MINNINTDPLNIQTNVGNEIQPYNPSLPPIGETTPTEPDVVSRTRPTVPTIPEIPNPKPFIPLVGGGMPRIVGTTPTVPTLTLPDIIRSPKSTTGNDWAGPGTGGGGGGPTGPRSGEMPYNEQGEDYSVSASTGSSQNPFSSMYENMQDPLSFLTGQGINIGDDYSRYFQVYDPAREQAAYQEYGIGQQTQMIKSRADLMETTRQQIAGGFVSVGFGKEPSSGIRSEFGLQKQQASLDLMGDVFGLREKQEEDWWTTLSKVEEARGEQFGMIPIQPDWAKDAPVDDVGWSPPASIEGATYSYAGTNWVFYDGDWMTEEEEQVASAYDEQQDYDYGV